MTPPAPSPRGIDVGGARVAFRDRAVSDVLDLALRFIVVHARTYAKVAIVSLLPLALISVAAGYLMGWAIAWAVAVPLAVVAEIPFTILASRLVFQDEVRTRDVISAALRDGARVGLVRVCSFVLVAMGLFVLVVPGVWLLTIVFFLPEVMLLERGGTGQAFVRSHRIAGSSVSEAMLGAVLLGLVAGAAVLLADVAGRSVIGELLQFEPPRPLWSTGGSALASLGLFVALPYLATARLFLYLNVRTHAEGWDIQTRFAAIAGRADDSIPDHDREEAA